jgi:hypothetical protein
MDNMISDDELAALGLELDDLLSSSDSVEAMPAPAPAAPAASADKVMSQADIDALIASMNMG